MPLAHGQAPVRKRDCHGRAHRRAGAGEPRRPRLVMRATGLAEDDFLSGTSGEVSGVRATTRALIKDTLADAYALAELRPWRLRRAAADSPRRRVLALGIERVDRLNMLAAARRELERSRHEVSFASSTAGDRGKFENLNALLRDNALEAHDWLLAVDDDV